jgi:hypothetical protein
VALAATGLLLWVGPAGPVGAQADGDDDGGEPDDSGLTVSAEGGIAGWNLPGREYPVRVTIEADRLVTGVVRVHGQSPGGEVLVERDVEVSGGSTARVDLVMPSWPEDGFGDGGRVELVVDDDVVARDSFQLRSDPAQELVGLLPGAVAAAGGDDALPAGVPLTADLGSARPVALDTDLLALGPLALEPLDQVVAEPAELAGLPEDHRAALAGWVQAGGQLLLVGDDVAAAEAALPEDWLPGPGGGVRAGLGQVRSVGDDWTQGLLPSPTRTRNEEQLIASDMFTAALPTANELADAADLRLPGARALGIMLAAYVVVAGPIVFLLVRRVHRGQLAWVAIPLLAVGSTGVVFTTGSSLRRSLSSAQVTVYETGPSGTVATTWSLLANKQGGDVGVTLPDGWVAGGSIDDAMAFVLPGPIIRGDGDDIAFGGLAADFGPRQFEPVRVATGAGGTGGEALVGSPVAGYRTVEAHGPVAGMEDALVVTAGSDAEGVIHGTVRNRLDVALDEVAVFAGRTGVVDVGTLGPGEERELTIENATGFAWGSPVEPVVWPQPEMGDGTIVVRPGDAGGEIVFGAEVVPAPVPAPAPPPVPGDTEDVEDAKAAREEALAEAGAAADPDQPLPPEVVVKPTPPPALPLPVPGGGKIIVGGGGGVDGGGDDGDGGSDSPVVNAAWAATQGRVGWNYRPIGQVVAVGWTDEIDAPVTPSSGAGPARSSRSAVVARATVDAAGDRLADAAVVRSLVRGPLTEVDGGGDLAGDEVGGVWAFYLPESVDGRPVDPGNLVMNPGSDFLRAQLWTPDGWQDVDIPATGQAEVAVPPEAVVDGVVLFRWAVPVAVPTGTGRDLTIYEKEAPR